MNTRLCKEIKYTMNYVWTLLLCLSLGLLTVSEPQNILNVLFDSATKAFSLALTFTAVYCVWLGFFNVLKECGAVEWLAKKLKPLIKVLYGNMDKIAEEYVLLNMSANILGVSNAATPSAVKAIEILESDSDGSLSYATTMLFVLNATSLQLLPTTVMGMRAAMHSVSPYDIVLPTVLSTLLTSVCGVLLVKAFAKQRTHKRRFVSALTVGEKR